MLTPSNFTQDQSKAIDHLFDHDEVLLVAPKGFGKCVVGFTAINDLLDDKVLTRVLVLSTAQVCTQVWASEARKWSHLPRRNYVVLAGNNGKTRRSLMDENTPIVVCNFENLAWLFKTYPKHNFDGLLVDEITKLKSVGGVGYKKLRTQIKNFNWRVGMSADPVAQENIEIYGQMLVIDQGKRLGRNQENFKRKYFMQMDYMGYNWEPQPGGLERLTQVLSDVIYTVDGKEYEKQLPKLMDYAIEVQMPNAVRRLYNELAKHNVVEIYDKEIEAPNEAALQGKLLQMCCGCIYSKDEFASEKTVVVLHDEKMKALDDLLKTIDTPVIIAYQFNFQRDALVKQYNAPVFSASNGKKANKKLLEAWEKGSIPVMLLHPKSGSHGLNLQHGPGHTLICLSYLWSADEWEQLIGRLVRQGQKSPVVNRYTIFCANTVEDCVMKPRLSDRKGSSERFHEYLKELEGAK